MTKIEKLEAAVAQERRNAEHEARWRKDADDLLKKLMAIAGLSHRDNLPDFVNGIIKRTEILDARNGDLERFNRDLYKLVETISTGHRDTVTKTATETRDPMRPSGRSVFP